MNIRSSYNLAIQSNVLIEQTRKDISIFLNSRPEEIIFTKGATESLNMIAQMLKHLVNPGDEIITSELEHHSCLLPWMQIAEEKKAKLIFIPLDQNYKIQVSNFCQVLSNKTKFVVLGHISNTFGDEIPIKEITHIAHKKNILVILDAAQSITHLPLDVKDLDIDFLAFSAHKMYGPFGIGILFGKKKLLEKLPSPNIGGGNICEVNHYNFIFNELPNKFEPGTLNIGAILAFRKTLNFIKKIGINRIQKHTIDIINKIKSFLKLMPQVIIFNPTSTNMILFNFKQIHAHDIENFLNQNDIVVRTGKHCANLIIQKINQISTIRISAGIYNDDQDVNRLISVLNKITDLNSIL
ncbi:MAG: aminotransferase class V-fold PLP-dependent enzyme [Pigeon pea little leaf phytoplasma]|uniref:cysteine desulfurase n=1 Tax=Candidatus Phytoplasma fabacearum TaxID=2982628 RepID=A0ABU8ZU96_9MOLU|nr:aminotransferase class V-fold PLP-dependent enzyme ['Bituminaria bituminosa' little leaf phytoplasma]MDV3148920.1 aminotransferase class V-fold PLP-dependent enzyme [Pigeon pea little leaf phytoplasma]MDO7983723.1 aminotransferase class V-fold PLP-dependent enzyme ['Bituminaria bituminosa' little leaf phytoplasma]MDO8024049.1 aminotransferase class V-fold PLP-dependent enzyme ['Bituminaria bituminosa' little leaf phytoplasma]MDO8030730.1 aminotransferase class V-fold PLP-dependent enzyme ['B